MGSGLNLLSSGYEPVAECPQDVNETSDFIKFWQSLEDHIKVD
jgi:hypothetical protein